MILTKTICFFLFVKCLLYCTCFDLKIEPDKFAILVEQLGKILSECTLKEMYYSGVVRHSRSNTNWPIEFVSNISTVNLKESETGEEFVGLSSLRKPKKIHNLQMFIILTFSLDNFHHLIRKLRKTYLWNPLAQYLILDDQKESAGCQNAVTFLNVSWEEDMLYSTFFCEDPKDGFTMYSYNPYTRKAPEPWTEVNASQYTFKNHVWSLFKQQLIPGQTTCRDFNFDKTITMDGHPLNALVIHLEDAFVVSDNGTGLERLGGPDSVIMKTALAKLNPHLNLSVVIDNPNITWDIYDVPVHSGAYDIMLNTRYLYTKGNCVTTYPYLYSGIALMTQHPGYEKGYVKILTYMSPKVIGAVFLVFAGTSLVLCLCTRKGLTHSSLEAYRLLLGASIVRSPRRNPLRIFLATVILLFMLTNAAFQSSLASLLTIPVHKPYVETADDIRDNPDFVLYVPSRQKQIITDDWMEPQIRLRRRDQCIKYIKENPRQGCAADFLHLITKAYKESFHVGQTPLITLYQTYVVRQNWPLRERLSSILGILTQAGILRYLRYNPLKHIMNKWKALDKEQTSKSVFHVVALSELMFAFYILLFGFGIATIVFFLELYLAKRKLRVCPKT